MALTILDDTMSSDRSAHTARAVPGTRHMWEVSWLPGRHLDRNSAITAMMLADTLGPGDVHAGHRLWPFVEGWGAELGFTGSGVLAQAGDPPGWDGAGRNAVPADPEAVG
jgi:hypothetical protein